MPRSRFSKYPRFLTRLPWWWADFLKRLERGQVWAKGDKGDAGVLPEGLLVSTPPAGCKKATNIYVNKDGKLVVDFDDSL